MLEILINGQSVDLPDDISFNYEVESAFVSTDKIPIPFSTSIDLPLTTNNLKAFDFPDRIHNKINPFTRSRRCRISFDGIEFFNGSFMIEEVTDVIRGFLQGGVGTEILNQKLSNINLDSFVVGSTAGTGWLYEGGVLTIADKQFQAIYKTLFPIVIGGYQNFVVAPIRYTPNNYDEYNRGKPYANYRRMYINPGWGSANYQKVTYNIYYEVYDVMGTILPAINLSHMIDGIFGESLESNPFKVGEFKKVVLQTLYHPELKDGQLGAPVLDDEVDRSNNHTRTFRLSSFLPPKKSAADFVKEILKVFCGSLFIENGKFLFKFNKDVCNDSSYIDLSDVPCRIISTTNEKGMSYKYGYSDISDILPKAFQGTASNFSNIYMGGAVGADVMYVLGQDSTQYVSREKRSQRVQEWTYAIEYSGFGESAENPNEDIDPFDATAAICPMNNSIHNVWNSPDVYTDPDDGHVPQWPTENGTVQYDALYVPETANLGADDTFPRIMLNQGRATGLTRGNSYNLLTGKNYDHRGKRLGDLTLNWNGTDGLVNRFHKEYAAWIERDRRVIQMEVLLSPILLKSISTYKKVYIASKLFYIKKISINIYNDYMEPAVMDLIEV